MLFSCQNPIVSIMLALRAMLKHPPQKPQNIIKRLRRGCGLFFNFLMFSTVYRTYIDGIFFYRISLVRKWYYIVVSHIVLLWQLTDGTIYNKSPHFIVRWRSRRNLTCKYNKKTSYFAYGLDPIHIIMYSRIVRIWFNVRIFIDYRSYIVRISRKRKR